MSELPEELLSRICFFHRALPKQERDPNDGHSTLVSMCLASKTLYRVVHPHLYHTIHIRTWPSSEAARRSLIRNLLRSETARLVRHVSVAHWQTPRSAAIHPNALEQAPDEHTIAAADTLHVSEGLRDRIRGGLRKGTEDAETALILCLCPGLQSLASYSGLGLDESIVFAIIRETAATHIEEGPTVSLPLQHLRRVKLAHYDTEGSTDICEVSDILGLPKLEAFEGEVLNCQGIARKEGHAVRSPSVTEISLRNGHLDGPGLGWLLTACPKVEKFHMRWGPESYVATILDYSNIGDALRWHGSSLTTLELDLGEIDAENLSDGELGALGNLSSLSSLRVLKVPYSALFERHTRTISPNIRDILPFPLKTLQIKDMDFGDDESLFDASQHEDGSEDTHESNLGDDESDVSEDEDESEDTHEAKSVDDESFFDVSEDGHETKEGDESKVGGGKNDKAAHFDQGLIDLMQDSRFLDLTRIKINRTEPFTGNAQAVGWDNSKSNRYWILLRRMTSSTV